MATIHLVIVADNKDAKIGVSVDTDLRRVKDNFFEYAEMCNMWLSVKLVQGDSFSRSQIVIWAMHERFPCGFVESCA